MAPDNKTHKSFLVCIICFITSIRLVETNAHRCYIYMVGIIKHFWSNNKWRWRVWTLAAYKRTHGQLIGLVWGSAAAWRCSAFIKWTGWTLTLSIVPLLMLLLLSQRHAMRKRGLCCRAVDGCVSVTFVDCVKTAKDTECGMLRWNRTQAFEWLHFQWPWTTPNTYFKVTPIFDAQNLINGTK